MTKVLMLPTPTEARKDLSNSINGIVLSLQRALRPRGIELVEHEADADLIIGHAGQTGGRGHVDIAMMHGLYPTAAHGEYSWHWGANAAVISNLKTAKAITAPSQWVADILRRDMHINPHVIGWGVNVNEWQPGENKGYVLWNKTRVDAVCTPQPLIKLAEREQSIPFVTTFGGEFPNITAIGRQRFEDMKPYIQEAGVYLATTKETFGIGTLEAMACGVPILGYDWGGTRDIVQHGLTGYLAKPGDIDDLQAGLRYCFQYRKELGANARAAASCYSWDMVGVSLAQVIENALKPPSSVKVSVVIPCFNYGIYVQEAVASVLGQQAPFEYEVIIVDDGSTDDSRSLIREMQKANPETVRYIFKENGGAASARNAGIESAKGEYILCLDADDKLARSDALALLATALDDSRTLGIVYGGLQVMDAAGVLGHVSEWPGAFNFDAQAAGHNQVPTCCMFRRQAWERAGGYRRYLEPAEDAELWLRITAIGYEARQITAAPLFHYRYHDNSLSAPVRNGKRPEPKWTHFHPWTVSGNRPFAAGGQLPAGKLSWPVRNYDQPKAAFIVPVGKGHENLVKDALDSIEGQTVYEWECIVVNDTGSDLRLMGYPWARVVDTTGIVGAGAARNAGAKVTSAPFLVFVDADDVLSPNFLKTTLAAYYASGRYIYTDWISQNKQGMYEKHETPEYELEYLFRRQSIHAVTALVPKQWHDAIGGFDETLPAWEDMDYFLKLATKGYCGQRVREYLFTYRYTTGARREQGEQQKERLKAWFRERYEGYMKGTVEMCGCATPKTKKNAEFSVSASAGANADMVRIRYNGGDSKRTVIGGVTKQNYGRRQKGDIFMVWKQDVSAHEEFEPFTEFELPDTPREMVGQPGMIGA